MACAEVGDDVYGDDPTVNRLEEMGADLLGKEGAVFVPSGTFGNQLALFTWCGRGTEVILGEECHIMQHEAAAASVIAAVQTRSVPAPDGVLSPRAVRERMRKRDLHSPATSLVCVENAHSSGRVVPLAVMDALKTAADGEGVPVHLDGARIFNAAEALGCGGRDIAARADSVMFCLSKGLCAPVGSLLAGTAAFTGEARIRRKIMGGAMRQAGILAAAGIVALADQRGRLAEDHERAGRLASFLSALPGVVCDPPDINMVFFTYAPAEDPARAAGITELFRERGILINPPAGGRFRFVTHQGIGDGELQAVTDVCGLVFGSQGRAS
jgi:threonine aldolase